MNRKIATTLVMTLSLGMLLALPASAARRFANDDAHAEKIARKLDKATGKLYKDAYFVARHRGPRAKRAVAAFHDLEACADSFRARVHRYGVGKRTARDFRELERSVRQAERALYRMRAPERLHERLVKVQRLMDRMEQRYVVARRDERRDRRHAARRDERRDRRHAARRAWRNPWFEAWRTASYDWYDWR